MTTFRYTGTDAQGKLCSDTVEATNADAARRALAQRGIAVETLAESEAGPLADLTRTEAAVVNAQVGNLVAAGLPLAEGLVAAADEYNEPGLLRKLFLVDWLQGIFLQRSNQKVRRALRRIARDVEFGASLEQVLQTKSAPAEVKGVLESGISSHSAALAVGEYSAYAETSARLRGHVMFLFAYPLIAGSAAIAVMGVFFCFLVPPVKKILEDFGTELPGLTQFVVAISDTLLRIGPTVTIGGPILLAMGIILFFSQGQSLSNYIARRLPLLGASFRSLDLSRVAHLLAVVLRHDAPMPGALRAAGTASGSSDISTACEELALVVENGHNLPSTDPALAGLPLSFLQVAHDGSDRDTVADALHAIAAMFEQRARAIMSLLATVVQPFVVILIGGSIAVCFYGLFLPILKLLNDLA
jgi:type IV pilus assembly protein PilC